MKKKIVLMYHDIYRDSSNESGFQNDSAFQYKIQASEFEKQVKAISEYCQTYPNVGVEFTFDDGGISFLTIAAPILEKYGLKGIFFISTQYIGTPLFLNIEQVKELKRRGHSIGSHSHTHPVLTELKEEKIATEWSLSVNELKKWGIDEIIASIPNGDENEIVIKKAKDAGITTLYTSTPTTKVKSLDEMQIIGRYVVYQGMTVDDVMNIVSCDCKRNRMHLKWLVLRFVKIILGSQYNKLKHLLFKNK